MLKAIFYKEWIKTRVYIPAALVFSLCALFYGLLKIGRIVRLQGASHLWEILLTRDVVFIENIDYIPALLGILLAIVQFVPEMQQKRLKLTLHLPYPQNRMILDMLFYGLAVLAGLFLVHILILYFYLRGILAPELVSRIVLTALPWYICGLTAYLLAAWITLEPTWKRRVPSLLVGAGLISVFFLSSTPESYNGFLPWMVLTCAVSVLFPLLSVHRFKEGKQD